MSSIKLMVIGKDVHKKLRLIAASNDLGLREQMEFLIEKDLLIIKNDLTILRAIIKSSEESMLVFSTTT